MIQIGIDPVAFTIGSVDIRWYGIFIALSIVWIVVFLAWRAKRGARLSNDTIFAAAIVGVPSGVIISRLLHVVDNTIVAKFHPELVLSGQVIDYTQDPGRIFGAEGLTAYGAVLGAALGIWLYFRFTKASSGYFFHLVAPAVISAQAIGRIGCVFNGCCYGVACNLPWGIEYTNPDSLGFAAGVVHPTQIYEIIFNIILFGVLLKISSRIRPDGSLFLIFLGAYSLWRIGIDFLRPGTPFLLGLHQAQVIGIAVLVIVVPVLIRRAPWRRAEDHQLDVQSSIP